MGEEQGCMVQHNFFLCSSKQTSPLRWTVRLLTPAWRHEVRGCSSTLFQIQFPFWLPFWVCSCHKSLSLFSRWSFCLWPHSVWLQRVDVRMSENYLLSGCCCQHYSSDSSGPWGEMEMTNGRIRVTFFMLFIDRICLVECHTWPSDKP